jgi:hypothetical protein
VPKPKPSTIKLQVFKGREAKLNKTIFTILAHKGPQTIYNIHKEVKAERGFRQIHYANVNKRVRVLDESCYIQRTGSKNTKAGFQASIYDLTSKAYLALVLGLVNLDDLLWRVDDAEAQEITVVVLEALSTSLVAHSSKKHNKKNLEI